MIQERHDNPIIANNRAIELVLRTEQLIFVLYVPKIGVNVTANITMADTEWMLTDKAEGIFGVLLGAFYLQETDGHYKVLFESAIKERDSNEPTNI